MKKRILSILLCLCMVLSYMPIATAAENAVCTHHEHDENCGFGQACSFDPTVCAECAGKEEEILCTCESEDGVEHLPFCDLYVRTYDACKCVLSCMEEGLNDCCEACYFEGVEVCNGGEEKTLVYGDTNFVIDGTTLRKYQGTATEVVIPDTVSSIASYAFENCDHVTSVTIPNSVTSIGSYAFKNCKALASIAIPNSVTEIQPRTFENCTGLISVSIPNSVTVIDSAAFRNCSSLISVTIPASVTSIASYLFDGCSSLESVTVQGAVTSIGYGAFLNCTKLASISLPSSLNDINPYAFDGCTSMSAVNVLCNWSGADKINGVAVTKAAHSVGANNMCTVCEKILYTIDMVVSEGGTVTADKATANFGETVTLKVVAEEGYVVKDLTVRTVYSGPMSSAMDDEDDTVTLTDNGDGTYSFTMPASNVEVDATFEVPMPAMQIFIQVSSNTPIALEVEPTDRIEAIKLIIQEKTGITQQNQRLLYADKQLEDSNTLADYSIQKDSTIILKIVYSVRFDTNGKASNPGVQWVIDGEKATAPTAPTVEGYTFGGWYTDENCTTEFDFSTAITVDTTLYAKWTEAVVSYNLWIGGEQFTSEKLTIDCGDGTAEYDPATNTLSLNNATITGHYNESGIYSRNSLNIVFEGNNKIVASPDALNYGIRLDSSDVTLNISGNGNLDVSGHFDGINVESGSVTISGGLVKATGTWSYGLKADTTTINGTLILAGGVSSGNTALECADVTFGSNAHVMVHNDAAAKYAEFVTQPGWQRNSENISFSMEQVEDGSYFEYIGVGHVTVTAANDGRTHTVSCGHIATFTENHSIGTDDECVCGYVEAYDLWVGGQQFTSKKLSIEGDSGTATFDPESNTLTLNNFSHTSEGYEFNRWMGSASIYATLEHLTVNFVGSNTVACSAENGYALYNYGALTITTDDTNGSLALTGDGDGIWVSGNLIISGCQVNATGITSNGTIAITNSFVTANGTRHGIAVVHAEEDDATEMKSDDLTITNSTVVATGGEYALFYDGGEYEDDEGSIRGGLIPKLVFDNKFAAVAGSDAESAVTAAADAAATYENKHVRIVSVHDVTYKVDGKVVKTLTVEHGKDATAPEIPAKTGYTAAWSAEGKKITADTEINAVYTVKKYTVTYKADGEVVDTVEVEHGQDATAPEIPAKVGHTAAWSADGKNITADTEINAVYTINKYTVTYKADGKVVKTVEVEHGKDATAPEIPAKAGHTALWDKDGKNITADTEINAVYTVKKYTVTYKADGKVVKTVEVEHGKDATAPEIPGKEGYNETAPKWDKDGKNITADTEINAVYTKNQPGEYADVTPDTNVGGGKLTENVDTLKDKIPFGPGDKALIEQGADVEIRLEIKDISKSVPADDKAKVEAKLGDGNVAMYLDISMFMDVGGIQECKLTELTEKTKISFKLPDSFINTNKDVTRTYSIIHVHDGKAEIITPVFDAAAKTLSFMTDRFSTYAVVYTDVVNTPPTEETAPPAQETTAPTEATKPASKVPETGDSFNLMLWATMLVLSVAALIVLLAERKRLFAKKNM